MMSLISLLMIVLGLGLTLSIGISVASEFALIAREKGYHPKKYFWYVFFLGIVGMLMVVALPDRGDKNNTGFNSQIKRQW